MKLTLNLLLSFVLVSCSFQDHEKSKDVVKLIHKIDKNILTTDDTHKFCDKINLSFKRYLWGESHCRNEKWYSSDKSVLKTPLVWSVYGEKGDNVETTLILCGVHGDEITPIKFCFDIISHLNNKGPVGEESMQFNDDFKGKRVVIAPIVNPDSFFKKRPTRTNANGVDINRNLPTKDFHAKALKLWKNRYRSDKRRYPGKVAMSEPESKFQVMLINKFNPRKIISIHSPLTMLDYDGPVNANSGGHVGLSANELLITMSAKAKGYRIKNYPFFPGSLGNYAGNERQIPTFTLELPTSDPSKTDRYWKRFREAIHSAMVHELRL
jgi:protein MpaA